MIKYILLGDVRYSLYWI